MTARPLGQTIGSTVARPVARAGASSSSLILDTLTAVAAFSTRKLKTTATNAARARRSSDNTESDITAGSYSADLTTFVSSNSGFVVTAYDQTGNSRSPTQATTTAQPRCVNSGSVDDGWVFDGTNDFLRVAYARTSPTAWTVALRVKDNGSTANSRYVSVGHTTERAIEVLKRASGIAVLLAKDSLNFTIYDVTATVTSWTHIAVTVSGTTVKIYINGVETSNTPAVTGTGWAGTQTTTQNITLGANSDATATGFCNAAIKDVLIFDTALDSSIAAIYAA